MDCLARRGQPKAQTPVPRHPTALRGSGSVCSPSASAPRRTSRAPGPSRASGTRDTESTSSTRAYSASSPPSARPRTPVSRSQRASTSAGARQQVPELIAVVPPRVRPIGTPMKALPKAPVMPPLR